MENQINILLTGAGSPGGPGIINAIQKEKKIFNLFLCDSDNEASGKHLNKSNFCQIPFASDPNFIKDLLKICEKNKIKVVLPLVTLELFKLSKAKRLFEERGIAIIVSDQNTLSKLNDKGLLYKHLEKNNIELPKFELIENKNQLLDAIHKIGYPDIPVVMKPRISNGSRGVRIIDNKIDRYDLLFNKKPNSIYITLEELISVIKDKPIPPIIISEYLPGKEITIDAILNNDKTEEIIIRTREKMRSGISVKGNFIENKYIEDYIRNILSTFKGLDGPIGFQLKESNLEKFLLLECNPRLQGSSVSAMGIGINIPVRVLKNKLNILQEKISRKKDVSFTKYYTEIFYES